MMVAQSAAAPNGEDTVELFEHVDNIVEMAAFALVSGVLIAWTEARSAQGQDTESVAEAGTSGNERERHEPVGRRS
ncbi:MAG: hypothetical protein HYV27_12230 [Candidatus Hydrogenedentes bacterium]|nr:hypothetical protein [Candidatus Hydrogenedentota bacterium]